VTAEYVSRREFEALAQRVDWLDEHGTRGVGALQIQVTDLVKDVAKVEKGLEDHAAAHILESKERETQRRSTVRWGVGLLCTILGTGSADLIALIALHH